MNSNIAFFQAIDHQDKKSIMKGLELAENIGRITAAFQNIPGGSTYVGFEKQTNGRTSWYPKNSTNDVWVSSKEPNQSG